MKSDLRAMVFVLFLLALMLAAFWSFSLMNIWISGVQ